MQLEHILLFNKIANAKSISKVAAASHISQPALSQQMQRLERSNRGIQLTPAGVVMQKYAEQFLETYENFQKDLANLQTSLANLHISATPVAANYALPCSMFKLKQRFPECSFVLQAAHSHQVIHRVENGSADIGFIAGEADIPGLVQTAVFSDQIYLVARADYHIPEKIAIEDLYAHPLVMLDEVFSSYRLVQSYLVSKGVDMQKLRVMCNLDSTESVKSAVLAQNGLAFLPHMAVKKELYQKQLKIVQLEDFDLTCNTYSIHRPKSKLGNDELYEVIQYFINNINKSIC